MTVVRLKNGRTAAPEHWGTRTDYLCGRSLSFAKPGCEFWFYGDEIEHKWDSYYALFSDAKPSHGLCAAFCAMENLSPSRLWFIGCDRLLGGEGEFLKWHSRMPRVTPHDFRAEREALHSLGVEITDLRNYVRQETCGTELHAESRRTREERL